MTNAIDSYHRAVDLFSSSGVDEAGEILNGIINKNENDSDALKTLGIIKLNQKDYKSAAFLFEKVIELDPHPVSFYNLGLAYQYLNEAEKAIVCYDKALDLCHNYPDALNNLALIYKSKKEYQKAEDYFIKIVDLDNSNAKAWNNLANLFLETEKYDKAVEAYKNAIEIEPSNADYYYNLATSFLKINSYEASILNLKKTLELNPQHLQALNNLGIAYSKSGDFDNAMEIYKKISDKETPESEILLNKANELEQNNEFEKAIGIYEEIINSEPENKSALFKLSEIYNLLGKKNEAVELISRIKKSKDNKVAILTNLALAKMKQKCFNESVGLCKRALLIDSNTVVKYNLAHIQLLMENYEEGWQNYEARMEREEFVKREFSKPGLANQDVKGKTILVYDEQGLGDSIQFVRYLKLLKEKGCRIIYECDPRLVYLFLNLKYCDEIIPRKNFDEPVVNYDYHISLLSLPLYFNTTVDSIPNNVPYLHANKDLASELSTVIKRNNIYNVGFVWAGNPNHTNDNNRSCSLENFGKLISIEGVRYYSLQKGEPVKKLKEKNLPVIDLDSKGLTTFAHTAAVIENLDLVISVDTSVAHLAGAMGKKVWVLLPYIPDWRWLMERNDSPWYPTMRLFRQSKPGNWEDVFDDVLKELQKEIISNICTKKL
jgi:tetratricopeptide (TPR) repeat protein